MEKYQITISKKALKFISKQDKEQQIRIMKAINQLPDSGDIKKMQSYNELYRLRVRRL